MLITQSSHTRNLRLPVTVWAVTEVLCVGGSRQLEAPCRPHTGASTAKTPWGGAAQLATAALCCLYAARVDQKHTDRSRVKGQMQTKREVLKFHSYLARRMTR